MIPTKVGWVLLSLFSVGLIADILATVSTIAKFNRQLNQIQELVSRIKETSDELGENLADKVIEAAERGTDLKERLSTQRAEVQSQADQHKAQLWADLTA